MELTSNVLTISGEKKEEKKDVNDKYLKSEIYFGKFTRSITVPEGITEKDITAKFKDGILEVSFTKKAIKRSKNRIEVEENSSYEY